MEEAGRSFQVRDLLPLKNSTFSNCIVGNSTQTASTNAAAYDITTTATK